jgi:uncharacterized cupredoxin-like copper-binding protein
MRALALFVPALFLAAPAAAAPDWRQAREYDVLLTSFDIEPARIELKAGEPVRLRLINKGGTPHSFSAERFFATSEVRRREKPLVASGKVVVAPGDMREILLVPQAGTYDARAGNLFHRLMGMSSRIIVR